MALIEPLFDGPLDIVGDIHGEIDALRSLLTHLGYTHDGREHPDRRRLVFVGDLCDRGPDSPAVVHLVSDLVGAGAAQCILGNHELNVLRGALKHGNAWIMRPEHEENRHDYSCAVASPRQREGFASFFRTLPLVLERGDLRVVHAAWNDEAVDLLRSSNDDSLAAFARFETKANADLADLLPAREQALAPHRQGLRDDTYQMPALPDVGTYDARKQTLNPVRRITSGLERASTPYFATGEWRFCERVKWWNEYTHDTSVVFGHYWRIASTATDISGGKPDLFSEYALDQWHGPKHNLYCVDFSVGGRFRERKKQTASTPFVGRLGAVRWPERSVMFDNGTVVEAAN